MSIKKDECSFYFKTVQTNIMKVLFEGLKDLLTDVNMAFTKDGIKILQMDTYGCIMVNLFIDKNKVEEYYCQNNIEIGISIPNLYKKFKTMGSDSILTMYMLKNNNSSLEIVIDKDNGRRITELTMDLLDLEENTVIDFPEEDYILSLNMLSQTFKEICQETKSIEAKEIKITYNKGIYTFSGIGNIGPQKIILPADNKNNNENDIYEGKFDLDKLYSFTKCSSISKNVVLVFGMDLPLICTYELAFGELSLMLTCLEDKTIIDRN